MRPVRQSQAAECGLACLAMIACHHGHGTDLRALRQRFPLSLKGATLARLVDIAQALGFQSRALRLELEQAATRLRAYEALEEEIDSAVVRTAGLYGSSGSAGGEDGES